MWAHEWVTNVAKALSSEQKVSKVKTLASKNFNKSSVWNHNHNLKKIK